MSERLREDRIHSNTAPIPPERKKKILPDLVIKMITGAKLVENFKGKKDLVCCVWNAEDEIFHIEDITIAKSVADAIWKEQVEEKNIMTILHTLPTSLFLRRLAEEKIEKIIDYKQEGKKKAIFIKDRSGCGYWRIVVPMRYVSNDKYFIDMSESEVIFDFLLEYDTIVVQRLYTWPEFYTIERLKRYGKKVIYDIDDDIQTIPASNPASNFIRQDQIEAAKAIMNVVDKITTTTEILKERLGFPDKTIVIPNALDLSEYPGKYRKSDDGFKRILWMGSCTHHEDFMECIQAIDKIMKETTNVRVTILGSLPNIVRNFIESNVEHWQGRVEYSEFKDVETYVGITKAIRADVGLAPLVENRFNVCKSNIKFLEYSACGLPCIASNVSPYKETIVNGLNGFLAKDTDEWYEYLKTCLFNEEVARTVVTNAVKTINEDFEIHKVAKVWESVIF